eukprot:1968598-Pyramimonas_sp.AAC.1
MELTQELGAPVLIVVAAFDTPSEWATVEETLIMLNYYMANNNKALFLREDTATYRLRDNGTGPRC